MAEIEASGSVHRRLLEPGGDAANVLFYPVDLLLDAHRPYDPAADERHEAPFRFKHALVAPRTYLRQQQLLDRIARGDAPDPLEVVEEALAVLDEVLASSYGRRQAPAPRKASTLRAQYEQVEEIKRLLCERFSEAVRLEDLGKAVGLSVSHLCRIFRRQTDLTVYRYLQRLRLRAALEWLGDSSRPLAELALDAGFSHQSHFTEAFRREYGVRPGELRRRSIRSAV